MSSTVKTIFEADKKPHDRTVEAIQRDLVRYKQQRERDEDALTRKLVRDSQIRERAQIQALRNYEREVKRVFREEERLERQRADRAANIRQGAAGVIVSGAVGAGYLATQAIQSTLEQARANRLLAAAATEAGLAQGVLAQKNKEFAESVGLSIKGAAETTAQITRLAQNAGNVGNLDKLLKAFADLGAARGIQGSELNNLIGTILSGQDEGLNRLGIADPGQLQKAYAASIGKTVEALTQQEKVQAAVNAVLEKSAIFSGAAEARMNSLEGTVAKSAAAWENFTDALAATFTQSGPVSAFLDEASKALQGLALNLADVNAQLDKGFSPRQIAESTYGTGYGDYLKAGAVSFFSHLPLTGIPLRAYFGNSVVNQAQDPRFFRRQGLDALTEQIGAQQTANQQQKLAADQQALANYYKKATDNFTAYSSNISKLVEADREKAVEAEKAKQKAIDDTIRKNEELKRAKESLFDQAISGSGNPFLDFLGRANREMQQLLETAKNLSPALREAFVAEAQRQNRNQLFGMRLDVGLEAGSLRRQAGEFRQGFRNDLSDPATAQRIANQIFGTLGLPTFSNIGQSQWYDIRNGQVDWASGSGLYRPKNFTEEEQARIDQRVIRELGSFDPRNLTQGQNSTIASAFEREADRKLRFEETANDFYTRMLEVLDKDGLKVTVANGNQLNVLIQDQSSAGTQIGSPTTVNARYK